MKSGIVAGVSCGFVVLALAGAAVGAAVEKGLFWMTIGGVEFRMEERLNAKLGSYGLERTRSTRVVQGFDPLARLEIPDGMKVTLSIGTISDEQFRELDVGVQTAIINAGAKVTVENSTQYRLVVEKIEEPDKLIPILKSKRESDSNFEMKIRSPSFRVVTDVALVFDHKEHSEIVADINASAKKISNIVKNGEIELNTSNKTRISLDDRTIISYVYRRICWNDAEILQLSHDLIDTTSRTNNCLNGTSSVYPGPKKDVSK